MSAAALARSAVHELRGQLEVRARQDRHADQIGVLLDRADRDVVGRQPDAGVDHVPAGVARRHRDHLGAVGVAVEAGLADHQPRPAAVRRGERLDPRPQRRRPGRRQLERWPSTPVTARYSPNTARRASAHSPVVTRASAHAIDGSIRLSPRWAAAEQLGQRRGHPRRIAPAPWSRPAPRARLDRRRIGRRPAAVVAGGERRGQAVGPRVDADHHLRAAADARDPLGHRRTSACFM
jgi:hypothetical protein